MSHAQGPGDSGRPALEARSLSKSFAGVLALDSVDLIIEHGEIHALLGENGSGKSTFIKILSGYHEPDPGGEVSIDGRPVAFGSADAAYGLGCRFVHQDLGLIESSSVLDNLFLESGFPTTLGTVRGREARRQARAALQTVGLVDVDPGLLVGALTPAMRTGVAVARAIGATVEGGGPDTVAGKVNLLVLDEPTATLPDNEVQHLLDIVRRVADSGVGVLYVTHRLDEVFHLARNVTVLRDGRKVATEPVSALDRKRLINLLVGAELEEISAASEALHSERGDPMLEVTDLRAGSVRGASLAVRHGDIVGIAGITGSGRETILGSIFGASYRLAGTVLVNGEPLPPQRPDQAMAAGVAYLPPDRKTLGGIMDFTARENLTLANLKPFWRRLRLRRRAERAETRTWFDRLAVRPAGALNARLATFSGGNQQKILFGKWLRRDPTVFLLDEPTQGVDVGAKAELHRQLLAAAAQGTGMVISSSDADELAAVCHRVLVLRDGAVVAELTGESNTVNNISRECLGAEGKVVAE